MVGVEMEDGLGRGGGTDGVTSAGEGVADERVGAAGMDVTSSMGRERCFFAMGVGEGEEREILFLLHEAGGGLLLTVSSSTIMISSWSVWRRELNWLLENVGGWTEWVGWEGVVSARMRLIQCWEMR